MHPKDTSPYSINLNRFEIWQIKAPFRNVHFGIIVSNTSKLHFVRETVVTLVPLFPASFPKPNQDIVFEIIPGGPGSLYGLPTDMWIGTNTIFTMSKGNLVRKLDQLNQGYHSTIDRQLRDRLSL